MVVNDNRKLLEKKWENEYVPLINGIVFPTGKIILVNTYWNENGCFIFEKGKISITSIDKLRADNELDWEHISPLKKIDYKEEDISISCGEGGYGGIGFIVVSSCAEKNLIWSACFEESNPFVDIRMRNRDIIATSNLGWEWIFPLDNPDKVDIIKSSDT